MSTQGEVTRPPESIGVGAPFSTQEGVSRSRESAATYGATDTPAHSHSIVPGGFDVTSSTTRLTSFTSLVMRLEIFDSTS